MIGSKMKFNSAINVKNSFAICILIFISTSAFSQDNSSSNPDEVEIINLDSIYQAEPLKKKNPIPQPPQAQIEQTQPEQNPNAIEENELPQAQDVQVEELKDLSKLSAFSEVSVIQKKFMPKSGRFQFFGALGLTTNTPWFFNAGFKLNAGYHFSENFGLELSSLFLSSTEREVAKEIRANNNLQPEQFIYTKGFIGLDLLWTPIYGKITFLNTKIVPYEMYFSLGGGTSDTNSREKKVPTVHLGTGQVFSMGKSMAFRWDYSLNVFQATGLSSNGIIPEKGAYNDLIFSAGLSFFFPEANYR